MSKDRMTTTEVANMFKVSNRTVAKWSDSGALKSYKLPGSTFRRFVREDVLSFASRHGIPIDEDTSQKKVVLCCPNCKEWVTVYPTNF